jgi:hypothetical protein
MSTPEQLPARYHIRIRDHLDPAALFGLLAGLRDLGATLLLVERLEWERGRP